ncbi:serine O-acetyltransferase [Hymenobacter sp. HDW8]|uniref:serine O-acetyltransferase n=1 Tax=Hymenobacter sp. HDW8 TaxID=2714932 RepID=UPI00140D9C93|nr:serine acetyltransferase [Hymenobacter sp. HDW8]QIL77329.1 serine acetyltransferase [Hymenobacter sp. HDW8]
MTINFIKSDLIRYSGKVTIKEFVFHFFITPGFKYMFFFRICQGIKRRKLYIFYPFFRLILRHYSYKYGFDIPASTSIGYGFYIGHFGSLIIHSSAVIGNNCNISQCVTIGYSASPGKEGCPEIGDNVFIAPGAVIVGKIKVADDVAIGANSVVLNDCIEHKVYAGNPAKIVSDAGSKDYVIKKWEVVN